jgi:two-component system chemotaxis response regulator CheY
MPLFIRGRLEACMAESKRVMVVDDAGLVRRYYRDALEAAGFEVEESLNGLEALEKLLQARSIY